MLAMNEPVPVNLKNNIDNFDENPCLQHSFGHSPTSHHQVYFLQSGPF